MEKLRWAPKVQPERIRRLYESDAKGLLDERLLNDVAYAFYVRCRSIVMVTEGHGICPDCGGEFKVNSPCAGCGRVVEPQEFITSYRHQDLYGGNGIEYFRSYVEFFPGAKESREKMLLIDQLLHAFHRGSLHQAHRSVANNLIEGTHHQVIALLDGLTFDDSEKTYKGDWQPKRDVTMLLRKGKARDGD